MTGDTSPASRGPAHSRQSFVGRHLDLADSLGEVLFGLIMVLTFTLGAGLIVAEGREATTRMLLGILGCNLAWGLIDAAMYLVTCMFERSRKARLVRSLRNAATEEEALAIVGRELDGSLEPLTLPEERRHLYKAVLGRLSRLPVELTHLKREDLRGAVATFLLVFLCAIPAVLPFLVFRDRFVALRVSNLMLLTLLFLVGYRWARATLTNPWIFGAILLFGGLALVGIAMALGG